MLDRSLFVCLIVGIAISVGCEKSTTNDGAAITPKVPSNKIVSVSYPLQYLTERLIGESVEVLMPVPADSDPQSWQPSREAIGEMQTADLIIANGTGATYAKWLTIVSLPESKIRNSASRGMSLRDYIAVEDVTIVHSHGPEGEHSHPTMVARTWLDPAIAKKQAIYLAAELKPVYPALADEIDSNLKSLVSELDQLTEQLSFPQDSKFRVLTATPKLKFFSRATGLPDQHLTWFDPPSAEQASKDLNQAIAKFDSEDFSACVILFDDQMPGSDLVKLLESRGIKAVALNLIDRKPESGDFLVELKKNVELLKNSTAQ